MLKKWSTVLAFIMLGAAAYPQGNPSDTAKSKDPITDNSINFDDESLFQDLESFLDSILAPHSYFLGSLSLGKGYYNFETKGNVNLETTKRLTYSPTLAYYDKTGLGFSATGYLVNDGVNMNLFQYSLTPSYDYLNNKKLATGISFSKYFTKDSLPFYTSPLQNELYAYFTWRKAWIRPTVAVSYGWGSRSDYEKREELIQSLRLRPNGYTYINTTESVSDFTVLASVRHDFYWLDVIAGNDHIRVTPQFSFTSGTQKFGFNQSSSTYATTIRGSTNVLYSTENVYLDDQLKFQPLSLTFYMRTEYSVGKFFIQPQFALDYYFPATDNNFNALFSINTGFIF